MCCRMIPLITHRWFRWRCPHFAVHALWHLGLFWSLNNLCTWNCRLGESPISCDVRDLCGYCSEHFGSPRVAMPKGRRKNPPSPITESERVRAKESTCFPQKSIRSRFLLNCCLCETHIKRTHWHHAGTTEKCLFSCSAYGQCSFNSRFYHLY